MEESEPMNYQAINAHCMCFNLRKAMRIITQYYDQILEPVGIRSTQFNLLVAMAALTHHTLSQIACFLVMDRTTLTRNLRPIEKLGLIKSIASKDRRSKIYNLTKKGRDVLQAAYPLWQQAQAKIMEVMGARRVDLLLKELNELVNVMESTSTEVEVGSGSESTIEK